MSDSDTYKEKLRVTETTIISSWIKNGVETTLWDVKACHEDGTAVDLTLRSFAELPIGDLIEYELRRYEHPEHGTSWTMKRLSGGLGKKVAELEEKLADLTARLEKLEDRLGDPEIKQHPAQPDPDRPRGPNLIPEPEVEDDPPF